MTPEAKWFAKVGVEMCGLICHTVKDYHSEAKRLTTTAIWKEKPKEDEFFND